MIKEVLNFGISEIYYLILNKWEKKYIKQIVIEYDLI